MQNTIPIKNILRQLKADLIGKDSYRGVTLTYSWLANQLGHFTLGFIPTLVLYNILVRYSHFEHKVQIAVLAVSLFWTIFECYNFLGPLLLARQSKSNLIYIPGAKYVFAPQWLNIGFDTLTDVVFFTFGALVSGKLIDSDEISFLACITPAILLAVPSYYWYTTKIIMQEAKYPTQFRLSQSNFSIKDEDVETISTFRKSEAKGTHLFIFGGKKSGKTALAIGLGTEASIKHSNVTYTTGMKLFNLFACSESAAAADTGELWTWRTAELLIVDDINPGPPFEGEIITPDLFVQLMGNQQTRQDENRLALINKTVIWVMGNETGDNGLLRSWKEMLMGIGTPAANIYSVNLGFQHR